LVGLGYYTTIFLENRVHALALIESLYYSVEHYYRVQSQAKVVHVHGLPCINSALFFE
jgi:hypothetical protein